MSKGEGKPPIDKFKMKKHNKVTIPDEQSPDQTKSIKLITPEALSGQIEYRRRVASVVVGMQEGGDIQCIQALARRIRRKNTSQGADINDGFSITDDAMTLKTGGVLSVSNENQSVTRMTSLPEKVI